MLNNYINGIVRFHKLVAIVTITAMILFSAGLSRIKINNDVRTFLNPDDSILERYDNFQDTYGSDSNFFIIIVPAETNVFNPQSLDLILEIGIAARDIPYFSSVSSIMESPHHPMPLAQTVLHDKSAMQRYRTMILGSPLYLTRLVAPDGRAAAI